MGGELVLPRRELRRVVEVRARHAVGSSGGSRIRVGDRRDPGLEVPDVDPSVDRIAVEVLGLELHRRRRGADRLEARSRIGVGSTSGRSRTGAVRGHWRRRPCRRGRSRATAPSGSRRRSAPGRPPGPRRGPGASSAFAASSASRRRRAGSSAGCPGMRTPAARRSRTRTGGPRRRTGSRRRTSRQQLADLEVRLAPDLAVRVNLLRRRRRRARHVVAHVAEVQRVRHELLARPGHIAGRREVHPEVADGALTCCPCRTCRLACPFSSEVGTKPFPTRYSMPNMSPWDSPMAPA